MRLPAHPDASVNEVNGKDLRARVTKDHKVFIGDVELPGYIAEGGLRIESGGDRDTNCLLVRFIVGDIDIDDGVICDVDIIRARSQLKESCVSD